MGTPVKTVQQQITETLMDLMACREKMSASFNLKDFQMGKKIRKKYMDARYALWNIVKISAKA